MTVFESSLRKIFDNVDGIRDTKYIGRDIYAVLSDENRMRARFETLGIHERYEALKVSILTKNGGEIDSNTIRLDEIWGKNYRYCGDKTGPYIWTCSGESEWYTPEPSKNDYMKLSNTISDYVGFFNDQELAQNEGMVGMSGM